LFTKDYTLLIGLKYYIKLSTKLLSYNVPRSRDLDIEAIFLRWVGSV
jgi:hypothetical protein